MKSDLPHREVPVRIIYRTKKQGHTRHGGAWKVAFADFMTAMFALFLVLWLINQSTDIKSAIAGYFQDPLGRADEFGSSILPGDGAQASLVRPVTSHDVFDLRRDRLLQFADHLKEKLEKVPEFKSVRKDIEIDITSDGLRIQLLEDSTGVFFQTGSARPSARGEHVLALLGGELANLTNRIQIEGHTDARPYAGSGTYTNWELSADRANLARRILNANGLPEQRVAQVRGYADRELRVPNDPFAASNRRIAITLLFDAPTAADSTAAAHGDSTAAARGDSAGTPAATATADGGRAPSAGARTTPPVVAPRALQVAPAAAGDPGAPR